MLLDALAFSMESIANYFAFAEEKTKRHLFADQLLSFLIDKLS